MNKEMGDHMNDLNFLNESRLPKDPNKDPEFGIPQEEKYPLFDEKHVRSAIKLFGHVEPKYESQLARAIIKRMKKYNIPFEFVGEENKLYKYISHNLKESVDDIMKKKWNIEDFNTAEKIGAELARLHAEKEKHLKEDDMSSVYFKNIDDHIEQLNKKMKEFDCKCERITEEAEAVKKETVVLNNLRSDVQDELSAVKNYDSHADEAEAAGYDDIAKILRDIRDEEKVHIGELQSLLIKHDKEYEESLEDGEEEVEEELTESVLDPVNKERCPEVFKNDVMREDVRKFILGIIEDAKAKIPFKFNLLNVLMVGSSTGYQYTLTSDIDVEIETDIPENKKWDAIKNTPKGIMLPDTQKPVNVFFMFNGQKYDFKNAENVYDVLNNKWLKKSNKTNLKVPYNYIKDLSMFFMNGCDLALSKYEQDKREFEEYLSLNPETQEISEKEKWEAVDRKIVDIKNDADLLKMAHHVIFAFEKEGYEDMPFKVNIEMKNDDPRYSVNNLVYKMIDRFGYLEKMDSKAKEARELIKKNEERIKTDIAKADDHLQEDSVNTPEEIEDENETIDIANKLLKNNNETAKKDNLKEDYEKPSEGPSSLIPEYMKKKIKPKTEEELKREANIKNSIDSAKWQKQKKELEKNSINADDLIPSWFKEALNEDFENYILEEELLNEELSKKQHRRWKFAKYCIKFLKEDSLNQILSRIYGKDSEWLSKSKKEKIEKLRQLSERIPESTKENIMNSSYSKQTEKLLKKKEKVAKIVGGSTTGATAAGGSAYTVAATLSAKASYDAAVTAGGIAINLTGLVTVLSGLLTLLATAIVAVVSGVVAGTMHYRNRKTIAKIDVDEMMNELSKKQFKESFNYEEATKKLRKNIELNKKFFEARDLALMAETKEQKEKAIQMLEMSIKLLTENKISEDESIDIQLLESFLNDENLNESLSISDNRSYRLVIRIIRRYLNDETAAELLNHIYNTDEWNEKTSYAKDKLIYIIEKLPEENKKRIVNNSDLKRFLYQVKKDERKYNFSLNNKTQHAAKIGLGAGIVAGLTSGSIVLSALLIVIGALIKDAGTKAAEDSEFRKAEFDNSLNNALTEIKENIKTELKK